MAMMISWVMPVNPSHPYLENDPAPSFAPTICAFHLGFSLVLSQCCIVRYYMVRPWMLPFGQKQCCGRGIHGARNIRSPSGCPGKGTAQEDDPGWQEFRPGDYQGAHPAQDRRGLDRFPGGCGLGRVGSYGVPHQAAVCRGGTGGGAAAP